MKKVTYSELFNQTQDRCTYDSLQQTVAAQTQAITQMVEAFQSLTVQNEANDAVILDPQRQGNIEDQSAELMAMRDVIDRQARMRPRSELHLPCLSVQPFRQAPPLGLAVGHILRNNGATWNVDGTIYAKTGPGNIQDEKDCRVKENGKINLYQTVKSAMKFGHARGYQAQL